MFRFAANAGAITDVLAPLAGAAHRLTYALLVVGGGMLAGGLAARWLHSRGLHWSWSLVAGLPAALAWSAIDRSGLLIRVAGAWAARRGARWQRVERSAGGDVARAAADRLGPLDGARRLAAEWLQRRRGRPGRLSADGLAIGNDARGAEVRVPLGGRGGGSHVLVVGATGSGKTVTQMHLAAGAVREGMGAVFVDPKGDDFVAERLRQVAADAGRPFLEWTPGGPSVYNPFGHGAETEVADKALAGEHFSEPHYMRQAQRYLGQEVRALRGAGIPVSLARLVTHLEPARLELVARRLPEAQAAPLFAYLDSLTPRQTRDLSGVRDRLAVVCESDAGRWLDPDTGAGKCFDLLGALRERAVVLFRLDADRRVLLSRMLGAAVVQDLVTVVAALQTDPVPAVAVIDEFSAIAVDQVGRLFGRARSAGLSVVLATQEISELSTRDGGRLLKQVLGNVSSLVAHRQSVPESARLVADFAGTRGAWAATLRDDGQASHRRVCEHVVTPEAIAALVPSRAVVIVPGRHPAARLTQVHSPAESI